MNGVIRLGHRPSGSVYVAFLLKRSRELFDFFHYEVAPDGAIAFPARLWRDL
jgi:hypothetical protein